MREKSVELRAKTTLELSIRFGWALSTIKRVASSRAAITTRFESKEKAARQRLICRQCNNFALILKKNGTT